MNPEDRETLFTIAEVAVAFVGFASLVSVLGSRAGRDNPRIDATRLRIMLFTSLSAISLCFFPVLFFRLGLSPSSTWRLSGVALLMGVGVPSVRNLLDTRSNLEAGVTPGVGITIATAVTYFIPGALSIALVLGRGEAPAYIGGVLVILAGSGLAFARLVLSYSSAPGNAKPDVE